jgi:hypothetical protein
VGTVFVVDCLWHVVVGKAKLTIIDCVRYSVVILLGVNSYLTCIALCILLTNRLLDFISSV